MPIRMATMAITASSSIRETPAIRRGRMGGNRAATALYMVADSRHASLRESDDTPGHHAAAALTAENSLDMVPGPGGNKVPRLFGLTFAAVHAFDEYGQMEEYLRMNGIVPPASQPK